MKILTLLLCFAAISSALTDREILQQGLNGLMEANKLPDSTTVIACLDDDTAHRTVIFIGDVFKKGAAGSVSDLIQVISMVKDFFDNLPQPVQKCLESNKDLEALGYKYGITPTTDPATIEKKLVTYVTLHYLQVHKWLVSLNDLWQGGKYYQVGFDGAGYLHQVLGLTLI